MRKILSLVLCLMLALSLCSFASAEAAGPEFSFDIISHVYDYHDSAIAVVISLDREVSTQSLTTRSFSIHATNTDNQHGNAEVYYDGPRTITDIYANTTGLVGDKAEAGNYIVIELLNGANIDEALVCPYLADTYAQSAMLTLEYTVTQHQDLGAALPLSEGATYVQGALKTDTVDEFAYGDNYGVAYRLFTPELAEGEKYPLVVWLHGFGERGTDNETPLRSNRGGVAWAEDEVQSKYPSYVMVAQASAGSAWGGDGMTEGLLKNIHDVIDANAQIDTNRIYVTGVSMGGLGTWNAIIAEPELFAAAMPMAPAFTVTGVDGFITDEAKAKLDVLTDMPIYIIHGDGDPTVNINATSNPTYQYLVETLGNPNVVFTKIKDPSYAGRDHYTLHNVEVRTFNYDVVMATSYSSANPTGDVFIPADKANPDMTPIDWMFAQSK